MEPFDPTRHVVGAECILDVERQWPNFHDAKVHTLRFWRGDLRPDDRVWVFSVIDATIELAALEFPYLVDLRFHSCSDVKMSGFDEYNSIMDLTFAFESRGYAADGVSPLLPFIRVDFEGAASLDLIFRCLRVEVVGRRELPG